ncbi:MAG: trigger factor [Candidatus Uhrbacteria bacterium]|nr:trigger factor [Candidatus Uhrbacteria bacterium]
MSETKITQLPKSEVKIEFTVTLEEAKPYLDEAVKDLTTAKPIAGFRPGKATHDDAKRAFGEMKILETALERMVRAFYVKTILSEGIDTIGSPAISVEQLVPGQPIKFTVIAPVEPKVTEFPDLTKCRVTIKPHNIKDEQVDDAIKEMRKMRRTEARVDRAATMEDLVLIDLEIKKDRVILEGGVSRDYRVYLNENHYVPGFTKQLEGIKADEERTFTLPFPTEHYQKHLAGQRVDFTVKVKGVFELQLPEVNDEFAKGVGIENLIKLREKLKENLTIEAEQKSQEAGEIELLEKVVDGASFSEIPDLLVNEEVRRMLAELQQGIEEQGAKWQDYLSSIKKTMDELKIEFVPQAMRRIKAAIFIKALAKKENITTSEEEADKEVDRILTHIKPEDKETRERVSSAEYREYVAVQLRNRKTVEWLKKECVG